MPTSFLGFSALKQARHEVDGSHYRECNHTDGQRHGRQHVARSGCDGALRIRRDVGDDIGRVDLRTNAFRLGHEASAFEFGLSLAQPFPPPAARLRVASHAFGERCALAFPSETEPLPHAVICEPPKVIAPTPTLEHSVDHAVKYRLGRWARGPNHGHERSDLPMSGPSLRRTLCATASNEDRQRARRPRATEAFRSKADAALDALALLDLARHDCYGESSPPEQVSENIWVVANGDWWSWSRRPTWPSSTSGTSA